MASAEDLSHLVKRLELVASKLESAVDTKVSPSAPGNQPFRDCMLTRCIFSVMILT